LSISFEEPQASFSLRPIAPAEELTHTFSAEGASESKTKSRLSTFEDLDFAELLEKYDCQQSTMHVHLIAYNVAESEINANRNRCPYFPTNRKAPWLGIEKAADEWQSPADCKKRNAMLLIFCCLAVREFASALTSIFRMIMQISDLTKSNVMHT